MSDEADEQTATERLAVQGYKVEVDGIGYIVRHRTDPHDVSHARHLADLIDLAELFEWRTQQLPACA